MRKGGWRGQRNGEKKEEGRGNGEGES